MAPRPALRLGVVYGRRRFGKSFLLRRLVEAAGDGGLYHLALDEESRPALDRFATAVAALEPIPPPLRFEDWSAALRYALERLGRGRAEPRLLVLDEYPYLRRTSPEIDSAIQSLMDAAASGALGRDWHGPVTLIVCGSAMSVMTELLSGTAPLRGRATLDMPLAAFDFRESRGLWAIDDPMTAFALHAIVGGAPGYRDLTAGVEVPERSDGLGAWLAATVLNPSHALFREDEYLLREDPRVTRQSLYYSLLNAIAGGSATPTEIAARIGRRATDIAHHLGVLLSAGFVTRDEDLLADRHPTYQIADPIVRFQGLITRRHRDLLEDRRPGQVWELAQEAFRSKILGPHFETVCRLWTMRYAAETTLGGPIGPVRRLQVNDPRGGNFELDVTAATYESRARRNKTIQVLGEAKSAAQGCGMGDLDRLDLCADLLRQRKGVAVSRSAKRVLFSRHGFSPELSAAARDREDVELVDLQRLYDGN